MTIRSSLYFTFNGVRSDEFGIVNVNLDSGLQSEPLAARRSIKEQRIRGRDRGYFQEVELEPLQFSLTFAFEEKWNETKIREVARWILSPQYYVPLVFAEDMDRIFYCLCVDSPELIHNCLQEGYITLTFQCMDAYTYTRTYEEIYDLSSNPPEGTMITFHNFGDVECKPVVSIYKIDSGDVRVYNQSNGNAEMTIKNLADQETVEIDCENRSITTDLPLTYRYDDLQGDYLRLPIHYNYLLVQGKCSLKIKYQLKRIQ